MDELQELEAYILEGRHFTSAHRQVIEELGFTATCWSGLQDSILITLQCADSSPHGSNCCVMNLPSEGAAFERLVNAPVLEQVLGAMATAWEPDWGVATSNLLRDHVAPQDEDVFAGWLTYFSRHRGTVPPLPAPARIEPVGTQGSLILLSPERFSAANPEHLELLSRLQRHLDRAGLLRPLEAPPSSR